jgi:hypothetical protein
MDNKTFINGWVVLGIGPLVRELFDGLSIVAFGAATFGLVRSRCITGER